MKLIQTMKESAQHLKHLRSLTGVSMLLAVSILLTYFFRLDLGGNLNIGLSYTATALMGMLFGPAATGIANGIGDIIKVIIRPQGPYFPGYTLNAVLAGMIYGFFLYRKPPTLLRTALVKTTINLVINAFLNTFWMAVTMGQGFYAMIPVRIIKNLTMLPLEILVLYLVLNAADRALARAGIKQRLYRFS